MALLHQRQLSRLGVLVQRVTDGIAVKEQATRVLVEHPDILVIVALVLKAYSVVLLIAGGGRHTHHFQVWVGSVLGMSQRLWGNPEVTYAGYAVRRRNRRRSHNATQHIHHIELHRGDSIVPIQGHQIVLEISGATGVRLIWVLDEVGTLYVEGYTRACT